MSRPLLRAYVDETGDRGMKPSSSSYFAFAAVICRDENARRLTAELSTLGARMTRPPHVVLHWSRNIKDHADRKLSVSRFADLPVRVIYVVVPKSSVRSDSLLARSTEGYYNYAARLLLERIGLFTQRIQSESPAVDRTGCKVTFGRVKGFHPQRLRDYINRVRSTSPDRCWQYLTATLSVEDPGTVRQLQWADIAAGALDSAIKPDKHGAYESTYWDTINHLVDRRQGRMMNYGLKVLGDERCITGLPWWRQP